MSLLTVFTVKRTSLHPRVEEKKRKENCDILAYYGLVLVFHLRVNETCEYLIECISNNFSLVSDCLNIPYSFFLLAPGTGCGIK